MKNAAQLLGRFFLDRRGTTPRILEVRDHLDGVYLLTDGATSLLMCGDTLSDHIGDIFPNLERAERALGQVMAARSVRVAEISADIEKSSSDAADAGAEPPSVDALPLPAQQYSGRNDPAFVDLVSTVLSLSPEHTRILQAILSPHAYLARRFTAGMLAGHDVAAVNLMDAQAAAGVDYPTLIDAIVTMRSASLLEIVQDALPPGRPELARFWIVVNPDCIDLLASGPGPFGLVA